jgi:ATP-dependent RNA helicase DeaD
MKTISFADLNLSEAIGKAISDLGFEEPTPIQALAIPAIRAGRDVIGQAHTGTGKTAAYGIPLIERIETKSRKLQAAVLCPTRELAIQVSEELNRLARYRPGLTIIPVYGGQPIERQLSAFRSGVHVVIATPGRLLDHMRRRSVDLSSIGYVVLDEADEMLDMGFRDDIEEILRATPPSRQTVLFSATIPGEIASLSSRYLKSPQKIQIVREELTVPGIEQRYFEVRESTKLEALARLLDSYNPSQSLVFCNTKRRVDQVASRLKGRGYQAEALHGDLSQGQRERVMERFRSGAIDIVVATDVAARGLDIGGIEAVFNYDVPQDPEYYVHRIGRTARAGRTGRSFTLVSERDGMKLREIQRYAKVRIAPDTIPSESDLADHRLAKLQGAIKERLEHRDLSRYRTIAESLLGGDYTSLDLAAALLMLQDEKKSGEKEEEPERFGSKYGNGRGVSRQQDRGRRRPGGRSGQGGRG